MDPDINIDMSQFHDVFFEECDEGIAVMEAELLNLNIGEPDRELINTIFRAAHSIKGSAGTFGFPEISEFTHGMETALNEMREGRLEVTSAAVDLLLGAVDFLRIMIAASKNKEVYDKQQFAEIQSRLDSLIESKAVEQAAGTDAIPAKQEQVDRSTIASWHIGFYPNENFFFTGNDPFRIIRELQTLGDLEVKIDYDRLPDFDELDVERCYLGWQIELHGDVTLNEIEEVFAWVEGDCELEIELAENRRLEPDRRQPDTPRLGRRKSDASSLTRQESASIRVSTEKVDGLLNLVGELVITQSILTRIIEDLGLDEDRLEEALEQLERNTRELQEQTMSIRMLPIDFAFQRLPRIVHDLSQTLGKDVELEISGEATELDKTVLEKIGDPLVHLVRNALDHGIESPDVRKAAGKPATGVINVSAYHLGGSIVIEIEDDGAGVNENKVLSKAVDKGMVGENEDLTREQILDLIFQPGFSTASQVSDVSGRGVGMDVVRRNITDLGGSVELESRQGAGSKFTIRLPLTLAILEGQMIRVGDQVYIIPMHSIIESVQIDAANVNSIADKAELYHYRDEYISILRLHEAFSIDASAADEEHRLLVVIDIGRRRIGLLVDEIVGQQQVVIKSLESNFKQIDGIAGATVLGDGSVAFILDVMGLSEISCIRDVGKTDTSDTMQLH